MPIVINIDVMLARRKMSSGELAEKVGITPANLSILKCGKAKAIRITTMEAICRALDCQPGDIRKGIHWISRSRSGISFRTGLTCRKNRLAITRTTV